MILIEKNCVLLNNVEHSIKTWEVWWMTPMGVTPFLSEAVERIKSIEGDPEFNIHPVSVAIIETGYVEIFYPRR